MGTKKAQVCRLFILAGNAVMGRGVFPENRKAGLSPGRSAENKFFSWCGAADIRLKTHTQNPAFLHRQHQHSTREIVTRQSPVLVTRGDGLVSSVMADF
jgi:hypothetical protein